jgi:hypothetical protein
VPQVLNKKQFGVNFHWPPNAVYVARPSKWGNPYPVERYGRRNAIRLYKVWLHEEGPIDDIHELKGMDLVCFCAPLPCHADYLLELANEQDKTL